MFGKNIFGKKEIKEVKENKEVEKVDNEKIQKAQEENAPIPLSWKEVKSLKRNRYNDNIDNYNKSFVIKNIRTGMIVEVRAASSFQAAKFIGWRPRHTVVIKVKDLSKDLADEKEAKSKINDANTAIENSKENCPALK